MSDIVQELTIEATPENVFHALTLPDGITGWWSNHVTAELQAKLWYTSTNTKIGSP